MYRNKNAGNSKRKYSNKRKAVYYFRFHAPNEKYFSNDLDGTLYGPFNSKRDIFSIKDLKGEWEIREIEMTIKNNKERKLKNKKILIPGFYTIEKKWE